MPKITRFEAMGGQIVKTIIRLQKKIRQFALISRITRKAKRKIV